MGGFNGRMQWGQSSFALSNHTPIRDMEALPPSGATTTMAHASPPVLLRLLLPFLPPASLDRRCRFRLPSLSCRCSASPGSSSMASTGKRLCVSLSL
uniref:Uncharacterized protein n=1 Tax=Arundo donax TaxID=35708 RepID=A0A0A9ELV0_ARUDO